MLFNSIPFVVFLAVFFLGWQWVINRRHARWVYITVFSIFFYGWWNWRFVFLLIFSGLVDYFAGLAIEKWPKRKNIALICSLLGNFVPLFSFKYSLFFAANADWLLEYVGTSFRTTPLVPEFMGILPVGISFYTFQSLSYTLDIYKGTLKPTKNVFHFFAYLSLFPQLVAGPIERASNLLPQLDGRLDPTREDRWEGLKLISQGYFKKIVIADNIAPIVNVAFAGNAADTSGLGWWLVVTAFAVQIYCDFSGYSDIARGLARWLGMNFMLNFDTPYASRSIREFWQRWHISLSTWFRDYVYIPLGGSKGSRLMAHRNMWITMLVSGLWHGAAWTFVIWGAIHAACLSIERSTRWPERVEKLPFGKFVSWAVTMIIVLLSWVFFRAESIEQALEITASMLFISDLKGLIWDARMTFMLIPFIEVVLVWYRQRHGKPRETFLRTAVDTVLISAAFLSCVLFRGEGSEFIYFQF